MFNVVNVLLAQRKPPTPDTHSPKKPSQDVTLVGRSRANGGTPGLGGRGVRRVRQAFAGVAAAVLRPWSRKKAQGCLILRFLHRGLRTAPTRSTAWRTRLTPRPPSPGVPPFAR
ncbi:MAG: hypothetical protein LBB49_04035, partial [Gracilibacteraceae bacterium]|nr:hypothetical protein [Gracilibacteraceae bacterium]